jgi:hypothetical protein
MPEQRTCESYEGCGGRGWIYDPTDSGSGRTCYCDCPAGERLQIEDDNHRDRRLESGPSVDESESIHERSERRAEAVTRWDGSEK